MSEAKGRGYDTRVIRKLIGMRKRDQADIAEEEAILDMYKQALGMWGFINCLYIYNSLVDNIILLRQAPIF